MQNSWSSLDAAKASMTIDAKAPGTSSTTRSSPYTGGQPKGSGAGRSSAAGQEHRGRQGLLIDGVAIGAAEGRAQRPGQGVGGQGQDELVRGRPVRLGPGPHQVPARPPPHREAPRPSVRGGGYHDRAVVLLAQLHGEGGQAALAGDPAPEQV